MDEILSDSIARRRSLPGARICACPENSASDAGLMRTASGSGWVFLDLSASKRSMALLLLARFFPVQIALRADLHDVFDLELDSDELFRQFKFKTVRPFACPHRFDHAVG